MTIVSGKSRVAVPPARTMPFTPVTVAEACAGRGAALGSMHGCSPPGSDPPWPVRLQSIGVSSGAGQAADVVEDDEDVGDLVEVRRRQEVGRLDDRVRVVA